jgi:formylglycine-generating enzyme required for sulfatase activity
MADKESENMEHQVFISYSNEKEGSSISQDRQVAEKICAALESQDIRCWIAPRDILPGEEWLNAMIDAVEKSKIVVLVFSSNTNKSSMVVEEISQAVQANIKIIPFRIENVFPQGTLRVLRGRHWLDAFTQPLEKHIDQLEIVVSRHLGKKPGKPSKSIKVKADEKEKEKNYKADKEKIKDLEEMPEDVKDVASKGIKVEKNKKGLWEAYYQDGIVMVYIPAGEFTMGSEDYEREKPPHNVFLDGYWMGKTEVTVGQFRIFINDNGYMTEAEKSGGAYVYVESKWEKKRDANWKNPYFSQDDKHPVVCVSWNDANAYCDWLSKKTGLKFKLPTEAQWEKAARGEDGRKYPWGKREPDGKLANFDDSIGKTSPVGSYLQGASPFGLLDMAGNVWEWCADWYGSDYYKNSPDKNPMGPEDGTSRVLRGGGWSYIADGVRCAFRDFVDPSVRDFDVGFRLCQDKH